MEVSKIINTLTSYKAKIGEKRSKKIINYLYLSSFIVALGLPIIVRVFPDLVYLIRPVYMSIIFLTAAIVLGVCVLVLEKRYIAYPRVNDAASIFISNLVYIAIIVLFIFTTYKTLNMFRSTVLNIYNWYDNSQEIVEYDSSILRVESSGITFLFIQEYTLEDGNTYEMYLPSPLSISLNERYKFKVLKNSNLILSSEKILSVE